MEPNTKRLTVSPCPGGVIVALTDSKLLDETAAWGWLRTEFERLVESDAACVWLDLRAVQFVSTSFLGVVVALHRKLAAKDVKLIVLPSSGIREVCQMTKLDTLLQMDEG